LCKENKATATVQGFQDLLDSVAKSRYFDNTIFSCVKFAKIFSKKLNKIICPDCAQCHVVFLNGILEYSDSFKGSGFFWPQWERRDLENTICDENKNLLRPPLL